MSVLRTLFLNAKESKSLSSGTAHGGQNPVSRRSLSGAGAASDVGHVFVPLPLYRWKLDPESGGAGRRE